MQTTRVLKRLNNTHTLLVLYLLHLHLIIVCLRSEHFVSYLKSRPSCSYKSPQLSNPHFRLSNINIIWLEVTRHIISIFDSERISQSETTCHFDPVSCEVSAGWALFVVKETSFMFTMQSKDDFDNNLTPSWKFCSRQNLSSKYTKLKENHHSTFKPVFSL